MIKKESDNKNVKCCQRKSITKNESSISNNIVEKCKKFTPIDDL